MRLRRFRSGGGTDWSLIVLTSVLGGIALLMALWFESTLVPVVNGGKTTVATASDCQTLGDWRNLIRGNDTFACTLAYTVDGKDYSQRESFSHSQNGEHVTITYDPANPTVIAGPPGGTYGQITPVLLAILGVALFGFATKLYVSP